MQIDIGFGDVVVPGPTMVEYPTLLDFPPPVLQAYPRETISIAIGSREEPKEPSPMNISELERSLRQLRLGVMAALLENRSKPNRWFVTRSVAIKLVFPSAED